MSVSKLIWIPLLRSVVSLVSPPRAAGRSLLPAGQVAEDELAEVGTEGLVARRVLQGSDFAENTDAHRE